jgi:hypothetical protein
LVCDAGFDDCDQDPTNGCEADLASLTDCGGCGNLCDDTNAVAACVNGACELNCVAGYDDCDGDPATGCEADLASLAHCGSCGNLCDTTHATAACVNAACELTCDAGYDDCDGDPATGCEADLGANPNCGGCSVLCTGACQGGACEICDTGLVIDTVDPLEAASAIGLCGGVTSADWVLPNGAAPTPSANFDLGHGIIGDFGPNVNVREGSNMLILSSGTGRRPTDPDYNPGLAKGYTCAHPMGFPVETPACGATVTGACHDGIALELTLQVPAQAVGFEIDYKFYVSDWPTYVCTAYNDHALALLDPPPPGSPDGNIAFDSLANPLTLNAAEFEVCGCTGGPPCIAGGRTYNCPLGTAELTGTGFEQRAATGWLTGQVPVTPSSTITLRLTIYDAGDGIGDSSVLFDNFRWIAQ